MGIVDRVVERFNAFPATRSPQPSVTAAAGAVALSRTPRPTGPIPWGFGPPLAPFTVPDGFLAWDRDTARSVPTVVRGEALILGLMAQLPLTKWVADWSSVPAIESQLPPDPWLLRPDPSIPRAILLARTTSDLMFYGRAHWFVTRRLATSFPSEFRYLWPGSVCVDDDGRVFLDDGIEPRRQVGARDVVEFLSPLPALLDHGGRALSIALQLDAAAERFAGVEVPSGILEEQDGGEDLSAEELSELADTFTRARLSNTTAATNKYVRYRESTYDPARMQLVEARTYQALELARLCNIPPYLVGAPAGTGMTYLNGQQARQDLVDFGAGPYIAAIEQTLSGPNVVPRGQAIRLDLNVWLRNPFTTSGEQSPNDLQIVDPSTHPPEVPQ